MSRTCSHHMGLLPEPKITKFIYVGSRKSQLALAQTDYVIDALKILHPKYEFKIVKIDTFGDNVLDKALPKIGEKSAFTKELEIALENMEIDIVVHSLKDLPTTLPENMVIGSVLKRINCEDVVILNQNKHGLSLKDLPKGSVVGTSSLRRKAQIKSLFPHLLIKNIRGNINTRLKKLDEGQYDAIILAAAGLQRLHWEHRISQYLDFPNYHYAVGQGVLAIECMANRLDMLDMLQPLTHLPTLLTIIAERSFLKAIQGGCSAPVGVRCSLSGTKLYLSGIVSDLEAQSTLYQKSAIDLTPPNPKLACSSSDVEPSSNLNQAPITDIYVHKKTLLESHNATPIKTCLAEEFCNVDFVNVKNVSLGKLSIQDYNAFHLAQLCGQELARLMIDRGSSDILKLARKQCEDQACDTEI